MIPFVRTFDFAYGRRDQVSALVQRVVADNPGPFTFTGTGTYIVGRAEPGAAVAVIDPGPMDMAHLEALLAATAGRRVSHVLVTHTHRDHAPLAQPFAEATGAPILAARPPARETHASGTLDEEEDGDFAPDVVLNGGEVIAGEGWTLEAMFTPGHASNHMAFALRVAGVAETELQERVRYAAEVLELTGALDLHPDQITGPQRQQVALARAMVRRPTVLLMDDPLVALSPELVDATAELIGTLARHLDVTTLMACTDPAPVRAAADTLWTLDHGRLHPGTNDHREDRP